MTPKPSPTTGVNLLEELAQIREASEELENTSADDYLNLAAFLGDLQNATTRALAYVEGRLS